MITLKDVSKSYTEGAPALSDINIQIDEGEFVFVVERQVVRQIHAD